MTTCMVRRSQIPKGATGVYRLDCPTSPPQFKDGEALTVVKKGPPGHCIVRSSTGIEAVNRPSHILSAGTGTKFYIQSTVAIV